MMKTPPAIPGFTFAKTSYEDLVTRFLGIPGYTSELLGQSVNGRDIHGFSLGDMSKPTMYIQGNIHGWHEWRTCWWVSEFMKRLVDPSGLPAATRDAMEDLKTKYSFYFIPSVNPDGYGTATTNGTYTNANGVSLSENFDFMWSRGVHTPPSDEYRGTSAFSEPESQIVRDKVLALAPVSLLCNHTWSSSTVGYTTRHPRNASNDAAITAMFDNINAALGYGAEYNKKFSEMLPTGSAYNWAETLTGSLNRTTIGQVWESGGGMTVEDQSRVGMTGILYHMLMVDDMLPHTDPGTPGRTGWGPLRINGQDRTVTSVGLSVNGALVPVLQTG